MEIRQIRYFVAVAEELHFRNAGKRLRIAQPSLSLQIRLLEEELNVTLFERTNRKVTLTSAGTVFLEQCRAILEALKSAGLDAQRASAGDSGCLRLGFNSTASFSVLPRFMKSMARQLPHAELRLMEQPTRRLFDLLEERSIDLAFLHSAFVPSSFASLEIGREQLQVVLPKTHPLSRRESIRPAELKNDLHFLPEPQASQALYELISNVFSKSGGLPAKTQTVEQVQTAIALVSNGFGVVLAPESAAGFLPRNALMIPLEPRVTGVVTLAVWRRDDRFPLLERALTILGKKSKRR
ncbi:LysR family transcriptional regulator [Silvibacterium sp.]|uniref:LysR family transcriptional regulator n=1 Tax=Silvibacterium sp. TaxID=1964179 RepID=UPI0039E2D598